MRTAGAGGQFGPRLGKRKIGTRETTVENKLVVEVKVWQWSDIRFRHSEVIEAGFENTKMDVIYGNVGEDLQLGEQKRTVDKAKELIFRSVAGSNCGDSDGGRGLRGGNRSGPFMVCGKMDDDLMMAPCVSERGRRGVRVSLLTIHATWFAIGATIGDG